MTAEDFVKALFKAMPDKNLIIQLNWPKEMLNLFFDSYAIKERKEKKDRYTDELLRLIDHFDCSSFDAMDITFFEEIIDSGEYYFFGMKEGWELAYSKLTGQIEYYDPFGDRIAMECAKNGAMFLDVLMELKGIQLRRILEDGDVIAEDYDNGKDAYRCAMIAGGEQYEDFYRSVL